MTKRQTTPPATGDLVPATAPPGGGALASRAPGRGKENITSEDITLPRIGIAQKTSPQLEPDKPEYIEGLKLFQLFKTATKENYGAGPLDFVVVRMDKRAMQFDQNNNVVDFNVPLGDPRLQFTTGPDGQRVKPEAVLFYEYIVILPESRQRAVLSLKGTAIKTARQLNNFLKMAKGDAWAQMFKLSATKGASGSFTYGVYQIAPAGLTPDELQAFAEETYEAYEGRVVNTDRERDEVIDTEAVPF